MPPIFFLLFLFLTLSLTSEVDELLITPPKGWQIAKGEKLPKRVKLMLIGTGKGFFPPSLNLGVEPYPGTVKDYLHVMKQVNSSLGDKMTILGELETPAGSGPLVQVDTRNPYGEVRLLQFVLIRERIVYVLTGASLKSESGQLMTSFIETAKKLTFAPSLYEALPKERRERLSQEAERLYQSGEKAFPEFKERILTEYIEMPREWQERFFTHVEEVLHYQYD